MVVFFFAPWKRPLYVVTVMVARFGLGPRCRRLFVEGQGNSAWARRYRDLILGRA